MCTSIDRDASELLYRKIKKNGVGYAWKLIGVDKTGGYHSPFQHVSLNKTGYNSVDFKPWYSEAEQNSIKIGFGCFHFFLTREDGRKALKWMYSYEMGYANNGIPKSGINYRRFGSTYKVVKVSFRAADFVAVGRVGKDWADIWNLNNRPHSLCAKGFEFVE